MGGELPNQLGGSPRRLPLRQSRYRLIHHQSHHPLVDPEATLPTLERSGDEVSGFRTQGDEPVAPLTVQVPCGVCVVVFGGSAVDHGFAFQPPPLPPRRLPPQVMTEPGELGVDAPLHLPGALRERGEHLRVDTVDPEDAGVGRDALGRTGRFEAVSCPPAPSPHRDRRVGDRTRVRPLLGSTEDPRAASDHDAGPPRRSARRPTWGHLEGRAGLHCTEGWAAPVLAFRQQVWMPAVEAAGLGHLRIHDLRATAASLMISSGANVKAVQRQLGHASAAMTLDLYGHLYEDDLDALSEALDRRFAAATAPPGTRSQRASSDSPAPLSRPERAPSAPRARPGGFYDGRFARRTYLHNPCVSKGFAEADGNRTRQGAFAPSTVLKTAGPTRHPDASAGQRTWNLGRADRIGVTWREPQQGSAWLTRN